MSIRFHYQVRVATEGAGTKGFSKFMASTAGRAIPVIAGVALIGVGGLLGGGWWVLAAVGLVPLAAGALDICLFNVPFGQPLSGKAVRASWRPNLRVRSGRATGPHVSSPIREAST